MCYPFLYSRLDSDLTLHHCKRGRKSYKKRNHLFSFDLAKLFGVIKSLI